MLTNVHRIPVQPTVTVWTSFGTILVYVNNTTQGYTVNQVGP